MESIIEEIFKDILLKKEELVLLSSKVEKIRLKKRAFLLREGERVDHIYYIHNGCLRTFFIDTTGKEHTIQFAIKGWWISDYIALYPKVKSKSVSYIECIKDATLFKISKSEFDHLCHQIPKVSQLYIQKLEWAFAAFQKRILENLTLSAKERYKNFMDTYPDIEQNVKNYHIASFLGITTESLSRIRKELRNT